MAHAQAPEGPKGYGGPPPEIVAKFDLDGDGKLNQEERKAARKAMHEHHRQKMLEKFDTDGDGKLSEEERKAAREARAKHGKGGKGGKGPRPDGPAPVE